MRLDARRVAVALAPGLLLALFLALAGAVLRGALAGEGRAALAAALGTHGALIFGIWAALAAGLGWLGMRLYDGSFGAMRRLASGTQLLAGDDAAPLLPAEGAAMPLARAINRLAENSRALRTEMQARIDEASRKTARERDRLGALMAELQQSVVVCNREGRILLYNSRARALFRQLSPRRDSADGAELIGLGRSIHGVIEVALIQHALATVTRRLAHGAPTASARFTTMRGGNLLQVLLAPVRGEGEDLAGYVLLLDDITEDQAAQSRRDRHLLDLTESTRAALGNIQAALDMLDYPDLAEDERAGFQQVLRSEAAAMAGRLEALTSDASQDLLTRWPLQDMLGSDLLGAAVQRIEAAAGVTATRPPAEGEIWLRVDSFALIEALAHLARMIREAGAGDLGLNLSQEGRWGHLDLTWPTAQATAPTGWQRQPVPLGGASAINAREIAERHGGEVWLAHDREGGLSFIRFLVPLASGDQDDAVLAARPEYYNFDLFAVREDGRLDEQPLGDLTLTAFDTETTGLDPAGGDQIIQLGAVRILNGRLLEGEDFDQLIDPGREIPEASITFHGITPDMVRGQPRIGEVLPAFHAFAADTVLLGHNVAFDMRFLQMQEAATGLRFDQPVLDTLLLATVAQPGHDSYAMEAIAERLGVPVSGRHSAAGDALTTARLFLRLVPLLRQQGIRTLAEAREAAEKSYYARLKY